MFMPKEIQDEVPQGSILSPPTLYSLYVMITPPPPQTPKCPVMMMHIYTTDCKESYILRKLPCNLTSIVVVWAMEHKNQWRQHSDHLFLTKTWTGWGSCYAEMMQTQKWLKSRPSKSQF